MSMNFAALAAQRTANEGNPARLTGLSAPAIASRAQAPQAAAPRTSGPAARL